MVFPAQGTAIIGGMGADQRLTGRAFFVLAYVRERDTNTHSRWGRRIATLLVLLIPARSVSDCLGPNSSIDGVGLALPLAF